MSAKGNPPEALLAIDGFMPNASDRDAWMRKTRVRLSFSKATNGDGQVTLAEFQANLKPSTRKKIEQRLDSGWKFDAAKWAASQARHAHDTAKYDLKKVFMLFDADGDGKLDIRELGRALRGLALAGGHDFDDDGSFPRCGLDVFVAGRAMSVPPSRRSSRACRRKRPCTRIVGRIVSRGFGGSGTSALDEIRKPIACKERPAKISRPTRLYAIDFIHSGRSSSRVRPSSTRPAGHSPPPSDPWPASSTCSAPTAPDSKPRSRSSS